MNRLRPLSRRSLSAVARVGTVVSATMLVVTTVTALTVAALPAGSPATIGQTLSATTGNSATTFTISFTDVNACPGDSATGGYRWNTYMVPAAVDPATLTYGSTGPIAPAGVTFTRPLYSTTNAAQVNKNTAPTTGIIFGAPTFSFAPLSFVGGAPAGDYKLGIACTLLGVTERFWTTQISVTANVAGGPAQFDWTVSGGGTTTTTTTTATTTTSSSSTTSTTAAGGSTTTSAPRAATTTLAGSTTSTTTVGGSTTSTAPGSVTATTIAFSVAPGAPSGGSSSGAGSIPVTGSSPVPFAIWALLLLVFGRMAVLVARPPRVLPPASR